MSFIPATLIFYFLLRLINRDISLLAALFSMVQTAVLVANKLNLITALLLLGGSNYLVAFDVAQLQGLARLSLTLHEYGFGVGLIFFGVSCLMVRYLMFRSEYFPKTIGILQGIAGTCYLVNSFVLILLPALADRVSAIPFLAFVGELATCVWLIVKGVRMSKWKERLRLNLLEEIVEEQR